MRISNFVKNFAQSFGLCAAAAGAFAGGAALLGAATPVVLMAGSAAALATAGMTAATYYIAAPVAEFFVGMILIFAGDRNVGKSTDDCGFGFGLGLGFSAAIGAIGLVTGGVQAEPARAPQSAVSQTAAFNCAANENRVEQVVTSADGKRTLTITCQPR